jgi:hypothetical protein
MKLLVAVILLLGAVTQASAQQPLGLTPSVSPGSTIKLEGIVVHQVTGGYLAFSVPLKDIKRIWTIAEMFSPHIAGLVVLEHLEKESLKLTPTPTPTAVPMGTCFLATNEIFLHHKILDRNVQMVGTYTYLNLHGQTITVQAYSGGPSR